MLFPLEPPLTYAVIFRWFHPDGAALGAQMSGGRAGRLDVGAEPRPNVPALRQRVGLLLAETLVVEDLHRLLERIRRCHMVIRHTVPD